MLKTTFNIIMLTVIWSHYTMRASPVVRSLSKTLYRIIAVTSLYLCLGFYGFM